MSQRDLEAVIGRAVVDKEFRDRLFANPDAALEAYELSEGEMAAVRKMDMETLNACGDSLGRRIAMNMPPVRKKRGAAHGSAKEQTTSSG